jgi:hypothetical protein
MKKKKLYLYIALILLVIPFLGVYQYIKDGIYIILAVIILVANRPKIKQE